MKSVGFAAFVAAVVAAGLVIALSGCGGGGGAADAELAVTVVGPTTPEPTVDGRVSSQPAGIFCGNTCTARFAADTAVTLTAAAPPGQRFSGWSGACNGTGMTCALTMSQARAVTATFVTLSAASSVTATFASAPPAWK